MTWGELRLIETQKPYLIFGAKQRQKERLINRSRQRVYGRMLALGMVSILALVGLGWWYHPVGRIQQVRWQLMALSGSVSDKDTVQAVTALAKDGSFKQAFKIVEEEIHDARYDAEALIAIAQATEKIEDKQLAGQSLKDAVTAASAINSDEYKARVLSAIAETYHQLEQIEEAQTYLRQALRYAETVKASAPLRDIAITYAEWGNWRKAYSATHYCQAPDQIKALSQILILWNEKK